MSNYPPPQYGGGYGAQDQNNIPYLPPTYTPQYFQLDNAHSAQGQANTTSNYSAYGYNRAVPSFNNAAITTGVSPLPLFQGWNQDSIPLPPYSAASTPTPYTSYINPPLQPSQYYAPVNQTAFQQNMSNSTRPFEQTELSEGEYDDTAGNTNTYPDVYGTSEYRGNSGVNYFDNVQHSGYPEPQDTRPVQSSNHVNNYDSHSQAYSRSARRGSDSYSPHISPVIGNAAVSRNREIEAIAGHNSSSLDRVSDRPNGRVSIPSNNIPPQKTSATTVTPSQSNGTTTHPAAVTAPLKELSSAANGRSLAEGRKRAQGAILNLWPYDVRFQTYINEGFREDIVAKLFDDLKMPRTSPKELNYDHNETPGSSHGAKPKTCGTFQKTATDPRNAFDGKATVIAAGGNPLASFSLNTNGPITAGAATVATPLETPTPLNEKERTIQAKMEALKKSREERAQKAAAQKYAKVPIPLVSTLASHLETTKELEANKVVGSPIGQTNPHTPVEKQETPSLSNNEELSSRQRRPPPQPITTIPGLFLATSMSSPVLSSSVQGTSFISSQLNVRKRPVAADFDNTVPLATPVKRPFGHNRTGQSLVIDVSDDEDSQDEEDIAMDLESEANQDSPTQSTSSLSDQRSAAITNTLPLPPNLSQKRASSMNSPAASTPTALSVSGRSALGRPADLQRKESEIEELKRRIAQAEARNKAKQTPSGTQTPVPNVSSNSEPFIATDPAASLMNGVGTLAQSDSAAKVEVNLASTSKFFPPHSHRSEIPEPIVATANIDELLRAEQLARQEVTLKSTQFERFQKTLQNMKAEVARVEAAAQQAREQLKQAEEKEMRLRNEKELRLGSQIQIAKDALWASKESVHDIVDYSKPVPITNEASEHGGSRASEDLPVRSVSVHSNTSKPSNISEQVQAPHQIAQMSGEHLSVAVDNEHVEDVVMGQSESGDLPSDHSSGKASVSADHALEETLQEAIRAEADPPSPEEGEIEMEVEMSDAPEPDEPLPQVTVDAKDISVLTPLNSQDLSIKEDEEDYEPPDPPVLIESPPFSPAPLAEDAPASVDELIQDSLPLISDNSSREFHGQGDPANTLLGQSGSVQELEARKDISTPFFTPYESPLKRFRAYRFHPQFKEQVAGGLRSLTYSNKINPNVELCRYESAGGICNDSTCEWLHFKGMALADDAILTALGSPEQFQGSRHDEFCTGLRALLMDLRVRKIRDFHVIASEILTYRAKFLADDSKILPLEGVSV